MLFSSLEFLYLFLPAALLGYVLCPRRWKNGLLLAVSLVFYGLGGLSYLPLMLLTIAANYTFGLWLAAVRRKGGSPRIPLVAAVGSNLALLAFFKYYDLFASAVGLSTLSLPLPIGISFYTFQAMSYVIDVYREDAHAQKNFVTFGTYVTLFPQLIAGPIVRYGEVEQELKERRITREQVTAGISAFCVGLSKKVLLANPAGELAESILEGLGGNTALRAWLWLILYAFQIYYDFSGYSDMAVGLGRLFGFEFPQNFRYPYVSKSITEFWRRWHITLSTWFREYVYIPLGGNRRGRWRTYRNLLITWALTGLWHGAAWNFLGWGLYFFLLLAMEKAFLGKILSRLPPFLCHLYALLGILIGWWIFSADGGGSEHLRLLGALFGVGITGGSDGWIRYELLRNAPMLLLMAVGATPLPVTLWLRLTRRRPNVEGASRLLLCLGSLILCTAYLVDSGYNPFLYFRF
ncbi:MAG: MBOAT family protein [Clostridia bacterium]|nr:MBOAT family protein [Clostridia bacterium]